ncbi:MAG: ATP-dependent DNA helicase [Candidatus Saccharimonadales bacterium]
MDFTTRYAKLNDAQKRAVDTIDGPVMVIAGPGTGKTELLSMRVANILRQTDTLPENILCLTFTESGANAMRERLSQIIGKAAFKVAIHTFHSFGAEVINQNGDFFYHGAHFRAADELSSYELLRGIFDELEYGNPLSSKMNGEYTHLGDTLTTISELKKSGLTSDELLAVLDINDHVIDISEPLLGAVFASRISKGTSDLLDPVIEQIAQINGQTGLVSINSLADILHDSLKHAVAHARETNSTKPLTAWRNAWMKKDESGDFILKSHERQAKLRAVSFVYYQYLSRMQEAELYDFDDMILRVVHGMEVFSSLRYNLQEKHQYVMVDEFQDTNMAQMRILHNLTSSEVNAERPNIMVVGDDDQAIYSFQGAEVSNILTFPTVYPATVKITLQDNYRSAAPILEAARSVIVQGEERLETTLDDIDKTLTAHRSSDTADVSLLEVPTINDERQILVAGIAARIAKGQSPGSIAVLARRHHEIINLLPYFADAGIQVNYERRDNVLDIEPIIALESVATLIVALFESRHDEVNALLPEVLSHAAWGINASSIWKLSIQAYQQRKSWMETMANTPEFVPLFNWLTETAKKVPHTPLEEMLDILLGKVDIEEGSDDFISPLYLYFFSQDKIISHPDEYLVYLEALRTIRSKLRDYQIDETPTVRTLLAFINLHRRLGSSIASIRPHVDAQLDAVNLMTAHKSKGLEFDTVYIIGAIDTAWGERVRSRSRLIGYPENLPLSPAGDTLDERLRLFFVAMTRARKQLIISYSLSDAGGKATLGASFLLTTTMQPQQVTPEHSTAERIEAAERNWYEPLISLSQGTMQQLLAPTLENYKLSVTHLNNFLDVSRGGPQTFLLNNLLRFPQAMSPSAAYGSAIHRTLQRAHAHVAAQKNHRPIEDILHDFEENLKEQHMSEANFTDYLQRGSDTLQAFLDAKYDEFSDTQKVELNFAGQQVRIGDARLTGSLDLVDIDTSNKSIIVTDYKTGKATSSWQGKADYEKIKLHKYRQQLMFYKLLVEGSRDYQTYIVDHGVLQFVEPTKTGAILALDATFTQDELDQFSNLIQAVWKHICTLDLPDISQYEQTYKGMLDFERDLLDNY